MRDRFDFFYTLFYFLVFPFFNLVHPCRVIGREHIPQGGVLICCNHTTLADPLMLCFVFPLKCRLRVMAKAELLSVPVVGALVKSAGVFGVERGKSDITAIKTAIKYLKDGRKVLMFPEGTRSKDGTLGQAKTGAAMLAVKTGVPVLPVYLPPVKKLFRPTTAVIGEPYYPFTGEGKAGADEYQAMADEMMKKIGALKEKAV